MLDVPNNKQDHSIRAEPSSVRVIQLVDLEQILDAEHYGTHEWIDLQVVPDKLDAF